MAGAPISKRPSLSLRATRARYAVSEDLDLHIRQRGAGSVANRPRDDRGLGAGDLRRQAQQHGQRKNSNDVRSLLHGDPLPGRNPLRRYQDGPSGVILQWRGSRCRAVAGDSTGNRPDRLTRRPSAGPCCDRHPSSCRAPCEAAAAPRAVGRSTRTSSGSRLASRRAASRSRARRRCAPAGCTDRARQRGMAASCSSVGEKTMPPPANEKSGFNSSRSRASGRSSTSCRNHVRGTDGWRRNGIENLLMRKYHSGCPTHSTSRSSR